MPTPVNSAHAFSSCSAAARPQSYPRQRRPDWNEPSTTLCHAERSHDRSRRPDWTTQKQQPRRRKYASRTCTATSRLWGGSSMAVPLMWAILCGLLLCCADAEYVQEAKPLELVGQRSALLFDRSEPPIPAPRIRLVEKRQEQVSISATPSFIPAPTAAGQESSSMFGLQTATGSPQDDLPSPFDTSLGNNFTSPSCPAFFQSFLSNATFQDCLPFSLLLQTSNSFFTTTRSLVDLTRTLDATCSVPDLQQCASVMSDLAIRIQDSSNCGSDFDMENPTVRQAYTGFIAYQPLYHAGCLTNGRGEYCYAAAINNASAPSASYLYYLPLGLSLPSTATLMGRMSCGTCVRDTMAVFALYAGDKVQPLSDTYKPAAEQLDDACGAKFVEAAKQTTNAAVSLSQGGTTAGLLAALTTTILLFFV